MLLAVVVEALGDRVVLTVFETAAVPEAAVPALDAEAVAPIAFAWKAAKDLSAVGLMAKTIPA